MDAADLRLVPFLKVDPRPARETCGRQACRFEALFECADQLFAARLRTHHRSQHAHEVEDLSHAALVEDVNLDACAHQGRGNVRLQIRKSEHQIRLQRDDPPDFGTGKGGHTGLFTACARRAHGEARDTDDAMLLSEQVQPFGGFGRQADDAPRAHSSIPFCARMPALKACLMTRISVTVSAASISSWGAARPVMTTCWWRGRHCNAASTSGSGT